jgi:hypothetical protein
LRGLPPSVEEIDEFLKDGSEAYEHLVGPSAGLSSLREHQANDWLISRGTRDTYGYQADVECDFSPWRDWVIDAFNRNMP